MASDDLHASNAGDASLMRRLTAMMTGFLVLTLASVIGVISVSLGPSEILSDLAM